MNCTRKITDSLIYVGADTRRTTLFEGVYEVKNGMAYNAYLLKDEKTALFDTVDRSVSELFFKNIEHALEGRALDFVVVQHMEPDHSATLFEIIKRYPDVTVVCNKKTEPMIKQFYGTPEKVMLVADGDVLDLGEHKIKFVFAPMVHWPEVMVSFDLTDGTLFSADAFGNFGATSGAIFADEVDYERDYLDEARRYYTNIVGKYGPQVEALLGKAATLPIKRICPLHGHIFRRDFGFIIEKYSLWASYTPEVKGALILYASIYGNTENAAVATAFALNERGIATRVHDVSVSDHSVIVADAFKYSHIILASPTYNSGIFVKMHELLLELCAHSVKGRCYAIIENGTWAATSGKQMVEIVSGIKDSRILDTKISFKSSFGEDNAAALNDFADKVAEDIKNA